MSEATTGALKEELWRRFGSAEHPAEWDGLRYGGGKISQRFWEYLMALELLRLDERSVVLDIGGASPATGGAFFTELLATSIQKVVILDPQLSAGKLAPNVVSIARSASCAEIRDVMAAHPDISHVCSLSVFEHVEPPVREEIIRSINDHFPGQTLVATLEYHSTQVFFEQQLTARSLSALFKPLTNFYLDVVLASPVWAENAFSDPGRPALRPLRYFLKRIVGETAPVPRWYPIALRFCRNRSVPGQAPNPAQ